MISTFLTNHRRKADRSPAEDPQRDRVYGLERRLMGNCVYASMSTDGIMTVTKYVCRKWKVKEPAVTIAHDEKVTWMGLSTSGGGIVLNEGYHGRNMMCLLHELAHHIHNERGPVNDDEDHGPEFVGIYRELLDALNVLPKVAFDALANEHSVDWEE